MNKKITIIPHTLEKIIIAAFLGPFILVSYIAFFVITYTIAQKIIDQDYDKLIFLVLGCIVSLGMAILFSKPFNTAKQKAGLKKGKQIRLQLIAIEQDYEHESHVGDSLYFPTLFTFVDDTGTHFEMEQFLSENVCKRYEKAIEDLDPKLELVIWEYEGNYYLDVPGLIDFRSKFDNEPITTVGLDENKIKKIRQD